MGRVLRWKAVDDSLHPATEQRIIEEQQTAVVVFGTPTREDENYRIFFDGNDLGYVKSEAEAMDLLRRLGGEEGYERE